LHKIWTIAGGLNPVTLQKYIYRLSQYWKWLYKREHVDANVWLGLKLSVPETPHDQLERPFTKQEMIALLSGPASQALHDLMRMGALSGARLDAIVDLRAKDCRNGIFLFKPQKREKGQRAVPIHSALVGIVKRRIARKKPDEDLFPEWPAPRREGSMRERSFKASNAFTDYRRSVGVDDMVEGKRRSLVNFHSFRRWFITEAERADQPESIIAAVVGHKRQGMTLGRYSSGPALGQARRCVEAVKLPRAPGSKKSVKRS
jgi:integrase